MFRPSPFSRFLLQFGVVALAACGTLTPAPTTGDVVQLELAAPERKGLVRRMFTVGPPGALPEAITVRLASSTFTSEQFGQKAPETVAWTMEPALSGTLEVRAADELVFRPDRPFRPDTAYTFALTTLPDSTGSSRGPNGETWGFEFMTPIHQVLRAAVARYDTGAGEAEVDILFTSPIDPLDVATRLEILRDGKALSLGRITSAHGGRGVRVPLRDPALSSEGRLDVRVAAGVPAQSDPDQRSRARALTVELRQGAPIQILAARPKESGTGWYFDIICDEPSAGNERWYWDEQTYDGWWLHGRCALDAQSIATALTISPAVPFEVVEGGGGFRILGDFPRGDYKISLAAGATTLSGGRLEGPWEANLTIGLRKPQVHFGGQGRYLPRSAWKSLALETLNVDEVEVVVRHVPPENLVFWMAGEERLSERTANVVARTKIPVNHKEDEPTTIYLDLPSLVPNADRGVYEVQVNNPSGEGRDAVRVVRTDMSLIAKRSQTTGEILAFVRGIHDGGPVAGVEVRLVRPSGQVVGHCTTIASGGCSFLPLADELDNTPAIGLIASKGDDLTFLAFDELQLEANGDTGGESWPADNAEAAFHAWLYLDRGVYRPGDTAHLAGILRGADHAPPKDSPRAQVQLLDPSGKELKRKVVLADANGLFTLDLPFADFATTGRYTARLQVGDQNLAQTTFNVEEFVPERMSVRAEGPSEGVPAGEPTPFAVEARWLFGGTAADAPMEADCRLEPQPFAAPGTVGWHIGPALLDGEAPRGVSLGVDKGRLDAEGKGTLDCPAHEAAASFGAAVAVARIKVFEGSSGRATNTTARTTVHPSPLYLGLRADRSRLRRGEKVVVEGQLFSTLGEATQQAPDGKPLKVEMKVYRLEEELGWWWDDNGEGGRYDRSVRRVQEGNAILEVKGGKFQTAWTPASDAAGYLLAFEGGGARSELHIQGEGSRFWWGDGADSVDQTPRPRRATPLALELPAEIQVDEEFAVQTTAPYAGWLLWSLETDGVVDHEWVKVQAGPVTWETELPSFSPNAYVSAFLIKDPHLESPEAFLPGRAHGVASVRVVPTAYTQTVKVSVPAEIRPWSELEVDLDLGPLDAPATATVAVVDEGILSLTRFQDPDPLGGLFARRRLAVSSFETVGWTLLHEPGGPSSRTGGDEAGGMGRVQMVKPVSLWSGPVAVPKSGKAKIKLAIPGYRGKLRVMAVASAGARAGAAHAEVLVRDPLVIQATLPRFLLTGDQAELPVFVSNQSSKDQTVQVQLDVQGTGVRVLSSPKSPLSLAAGAGGNVTFKVEATKDLGASHLTVRAVGQGTESREEFDLPVAAVLPEGRATLAFSLQDDQDVDALLADGGWLRGADTTEVWLTANPYAQALSQVGHLIRYPYGCIEQTSSATRPLLVLRELLPNLDPQALANTSVDQMVKNGVERILSMQTPEGGFSYWPGGGDPHPFGTAYATDVLLDAQEAGVEVPKEAIEEAAHWMERQITQGGFGEIGVQAYSHYVLARAGKPQAAAAGALLARLGAPRAEDREQAEARYLLQAAIYLSGDRRHAAELQAPAYAGGPLLRNGGWTFWSNLRQNGLMLNVFESLFPGGAQAQAFADQLARDTSRELGYSYTTQELAWALTALGRRVRASSAAIPAATLKNGTEVFKARGGGEPRWSVRGATALSELALDLAADPPANSFLVLSTAGPRADPPQAEASGLVLSRTLLDGDGAPLNVDAIKLGDRVYLMATLQNPGPKEIREIALVGRIPAGWEIENPRLGGDNLPPWAPQEGAWNLEHLNLRDDRFETFGRLNPGQTVHVLIELRATAAGTYGMPELRAEAMYNPAVRALVPGDQVTITSPWTASFL